MRERPVTSRRDRSGERRMLGRAIRRARLSQGRTLTDVSAAAGVSASLLSQVERGIVDPSLDSLRDIAEALGTAPFRLLADDAPRSRIVRNGEGARLGVAEGIELELLSPSLDGGFEVGRWTLAPGAATASHPRGHKGEEANLILEGAVRFELGGEVVELSKGDFVIYDARIPHRSLPLGDEGASALFVVSPPVW
ncbi:MAG: helix-turn-helix transcriptional regulator [Thermoleophilia bacterium]|nr:helix-turn-helix transcriptional regulator [Thermoleophilia bacterium]